MQASPRWRPAVDPEVPAGIAAPGSATSGAPQRVRARIPTI